ncbi:hypothetical protein outra_77 [Escherichia phage outra]|nr:hypothetical protein outra_77 [Escherichia phage outra]
MLTVYGEGINDLEGESTLPGSKKLTPHYMKKHYIMKCLSM